MTTSKIEAIQFLLHYEMNDVNVVKFNKQVIIKCTYTYSAFFLTLAIGIYMLKSLGSVNGLFSRNF
jgi:hypothetical protein